MRAEVSPQRRPVSPQPCRGAVPASPQPCRGAASVSPSGRLLELRRPTEHLGLLCTQQGGGVVVGAVLGGSPAEAAGVRVGDCVRAVDGVPVRSEADMRRAREAALQRGAQTVMLSSTSQRTRRRRASVRSPVPRAAPSPEPADVLWRQELRAAAAPRPRADAPGIGGLRAMSGGDGVVTAGHSPATAGFPSLLPPASTSAWRAFLPCEPPWQTRAEVQLSRRLGALQAARDSGGLTEDEFRAAVRRAKGEHAGAFDAPPAAPPPAPDAAADAVADTMVMAVEALMTGCDGFVPPDRDEMLDAASALRSTMADIRFRNRPRSRLSKQELAAAAAGAAPERGPPVPAPVPESVPIAVEPLAADPIPEHDPPHMDTDAAAPAAGAADLPDADPDLQPDAAAPDGADRGLQPDAAAPDGADRGLQPDAAAPDGADRGLPDEAEGETGGNEHGGGDTADAAGLPPPAPPVDPELLSNLREAFNVFDVDGNGVVSPDELGTILGSLAGAPLDEQKVLDLVRAADKDGDGNINYVEFISTVMEKGSPLPG
eukprot:TRINITY_DN887_c0_g1_i1.p1 TRINITY_DN887_c0_g1~~TRINITY_DN887_c0_g1_i1.p1  ORF type:complete len:558 (+),score=174.93 TRINITY_DN887_c0_g1_i1:45-1676(+)